MSSLLITRQKIAMRYHYLCYIANSLESSPFENLTRFLMRKEASRKNRRQLHSLIDEMQTCERYGDRAGAIFGRENCDFFRWQNDNFYSTRLHLFRDASELLHHEDFTSRSFFQITAGERLIIPINGRDRPLFSIVECLSREERLSAQGFRRMISESLDNFFLNGLRFDPTSALIYADWLEQEGASAKRVERLRSSANTLANFAGNAGLIDIVDPAAMKSLDNAEDLLKNLDAADGKRDQARRARKLMK